MNHISKYTNTMEYLEQPMLHAQPGQLTAGDHGQPHVFRRATMNIPPTGPGGLQKKYSLKVQGRTSEPLVDHNESGAGVDPSSNSRFLKDRFKKPADVHDHKQSTGYTESLDILSSRQRASDDDDAIETILNVRVPQINNDLQGNPTSLKWIHLHQHNAMDLEGFRKVALQQPGLSDDDKLLIHQLFVRARRHETSTIDARHFRYLQPGVFEISGAIDGQGHANPEHNTTYEINSAKFICFPYFSLQKLASISKLLGGSSSQTLNSTLLHPIRTLLQSQYDMESTEQQDQERVRKQERKMQESRIVHVAQFWVIILGKSLLFSCANLSLSQILGKKIVIHYDQAGAGKFGCLIKLSNASSSKSYSITLSPDKTWLEFVYRVDLLRTAGVLSYKSFDELSFKTENGITITEKEWSSLISTVKEIELTVYTNYSFSRAYYDEYAPRSQTSYHRHERGYQYAPPSHGRQYDTPSQSRSYPLNVSRTIRVPVYDDPYMYSYIPSPPQLPNMPPAPPPHPIPFPVPPPMPTPLHLPREDQSTDINANVPSHNQDIKPPYVIRQDSQKSLPDHSSSSQSGARVVYLPKDSDSLHDLSRPGSPARPSYSPHPYPYNPYPGNSRSNRSRSDRTQYGPIPDINYGGSRSRSKPRHVVIHSPEASDAGRRVDAGLQNPEEVFYSPGGVLTEEADPLPIRLANSGSNGHHGRLDQTDEPTTSLVPPRAAPEQVTSVPPVFMWPTNHKEAPNKQRGKTTINTDIVKATFATAPGELNGDQKDESTRDWKYARNPILKTDLQKHETAATILDDVGRSLRQDQGQVTANLYDKLPLSNFDKISKSLVKQDPMLKSHRLQKQILELAKEVLEFFVPLDIYSEVPLRYWGAVELIIKDIGDQGQPNERNRANRDLPDSALDVEILLSNVAQTAKHIGRGVSSNDPDHHLSYFVPVALVQAFKWLLKALILYGATGNDYRQEAFEADEKCDENMQEAVYQLLTMLHLGDYSNGAVFECIEPQTLLGLVLENLSYGVSAKTDPTDEEQHCILKYYLKRFNKLQLQLQKRPSRHLLGDAHNISQELAIVQAILSQEYQCLSPVVSPDAPYSSENPSYDVCKEIISSQMRWLSQLQENVRDTSLQIIQLLDVNKDSNDKAIFAFTTVTVIFLPLSFVTSYLGMNTVDLRDMDHGQAVYWATALPVTMATVIVTFIIAFKWEQIADTIQEYGDWLRGRNDSQN